MPDLLVALVKRLVRWGVLPARMAPDTAIINIYDEVPPARMLPAVHCLPLCGHYLLQGRLLHSRVGVAVHIPVWGWARSEGTGVCVVLRLPRYTPVAPGESLRIRRLAHCHKYLAPS